LIALSNRSSRFGKKTKSKLRVLSALAVQNQKSCVIRAIHGKQSNKGTSVPHYMQYIMELHNSVPHYIAQVPEGLIALSNRPSRFDKKPKS